MNKLLVINQKDLKFHLEVTSESEIIKNPIPILWNFDGLYGWIPVEIVKNEVSHFLDLNKYYEVAKRLYFTWHQTYRLRPDVGKMLEELANDRV